MNQKLAFRMAVCVALVLGVAACDGFRKQLGLNKSAPDEFRVVSRAPLSLPPDFTLRPPEPGAPRPQDGTPTQQAKRAVFRVEEDEKLQELLENPNDHRSAGERSLLANAGADQIDPNIRQIVERETAEVNAESSDFIDSLVFWRAEEPVGEIIDAEKETRRLRENAALGREVNEGETPTIERKKKAFLEDLF